MHTTIRRRQRPQVAAVWRARLVAMSLLAFVTAAPAADDVWVHVDTRQATLQVYKGEQMVERIDAIAIGRAGASRERRLGDRRTPLGDFRVREVKNSSHWRLFFQIDYPDEERAALALRRGEIDQATYASIVGALNRGEMPPQDTPLGGFLGIHGIGDGDIRVHRAFHWTQGCIAVTNEEIEALSRWIVENTRIVIE